MEFEIGILNSRILSDDDVASINDLYDQLSPSRKDSPKLTKLDLVSILQQNHLSFFVVLARNDNLSVGKIVGMAKIYLFGRPNGVWGSIEDVVVDSNYRRRGLAKKLLQALIEDAKDFNTRYIELTSNPNNPDRQKAIKLYESLGFVKIAEAVGEKGTNLYRLYL